MNGGSVESDFRGSVAAMVNKDENDPFTFFFLYN